MKKYIKPEMEVEILEFTDIVTASGGDNFGEDSFDISTPPDFN